MEWVLTQIEWVLTQIDWSVAISVAVGIVLGAAALFLIVLPVGVLAAIGEGATPDPQAVASAEHARMQSAVKAAIDEAMPRWIKDGPYSWPPIQMARAERP